MRFLININKQIGKVSAPFLSISLIIITLILCVNVIGRYLFGFGLPWAEELTNYTIIWITLIGSTHCIRRKLHVSVDILPNYLKGNLKKALETCVTIIGIFFSLVLAYYGAKLLGDVSDQVSPALMLPMSIPYASLVVGAFFMILQYLEDLLTILLDN